MRNCRRLGWVEWLFVVLATISMAGTLAMSVERFIYMQRTFSNITPEDSSLFWDFEDEGDNVTNAGDICEQWVCLNDFIFAVIVLVNLG